MAEHVAPNLKLVRKLLLGAAVFATVVLPVAFDLAQTNRREIEQAKRGSRQHEARGRIRQGWRVYTHEGDRDADPLRWVRSQGGLFTANVLGYVEYLEQSHPGEANPPGLSSNVGASN